MAIALCGLIGGAESWVALEPFGRARLAWPRSFLALPQGLPSPDTFGRVGAALDPAPFLKYLPEYGITVEEKRLAYTLRGLTDSRRQARRRGFWRHGRR